MELVFILVDVQERKRNKINRRTIPKVPVPRKGPHIEDPFFCLQVCIAY
jgi:hypothetical protein